MKKITLSFFIMLTLFACLCACEKKPSEKGTHGTQEYIFTDDLGREVAVKSCERTAPLLGSFADVWVLAGGEKTLCATADDAWDDFGLGKKIPEAVNLGATKAPDIELLLASRPTLVIASTNTAKHLEMLDILTSAGITVAFFDVSDFGDYLRMLKICTDLLDRPDLYEKHGEQIKKTVDTVSARSKQRIRDEGEVSVLFLRASAASVRAKNSHNNVMGEMLADMGCTNIADKDGSLLENLGLESIIAQNPKHIFVVQVGDDKSATEKSINDLFAQNPAWQKLNAVKTGRVHFMDKRLYNLKPNAHWGEAYENLEKILFEN